MNGDQQLATSLVRAYVESGMVRPVLPEGRREEIIARLVVILTDGDLVRDYARFLIAERKRQGVDERLFDPDGPELPVEEVAKHGLSVLSDDQLADLAIDPDAVLTLAELLDELYVNGHCGDVWEEAFAALYPFGEPSQAARDWARNFIARQKALDEAHEEFLAKHPECDHRGPA